MKYAKWMLVMTLNLAPLLFPTLASAQMGESTKIVAKVPFEFMVANKVVPAGQCIVQSATIGGRTLLIGNTAAKVNLFAPALPDVTKKAADAYALVFDKYGDHYFLAAIKLAGDRTMYRLPVSKAEAELRASNVPATQQIVLASLQ
jgi:hypothetical protein